MGWGSRMVGQGRTLTRRRWAAAVAVVVAGTVLTATPALGGPADDKTRVDRKLQEAEAALENATARARQAGVAYSQANLQLPGAQQAVARARGEVAAAQ